MTWRTIQLLRGSDSDHFFRIVDTCGHQHQPPAHRKTVDFNTHTAALIPMYAISVYDHKIPVPLDIILKENNVSHRYRFHQKRDLLQFQRAITGFSVEYME